ncbi:C-type lectin domain family 4 member E-like [Myripristis murdjan]|uniref:C-type lectin domain family 4 member E-like n=1 Tax=Myripristis murdjan TaxID=586833 RepID=UPI001175D991|nr:C-type lectin domain family 4 member E-like [Myripristis murdjan]
MEEIYMNVDPVKPSNSRPSTIQTGPRRSEGSFYRAASLVLGLLSVLLLAGLIGLGVLYLDAEHGFSILKANLTEERGLMSASLMEMTEKKDLLNASLMEMTEKKDLLNSSLMEMTEERDRLHTLSTQKKTCPEGWKMFSCACYLVSTERNSWEKARQDCRDRGADLVVIDSLEEQIFMTSLKTDAWIGLSDRDEEGTWKWVDETPLTLTSWEIYQPDNGNDDPKWGEEDCVQIRPNKHKEKNWNDCSCVASVQWICEKAA